MQKRELREIQKDIVATKKTAFRDLSNWPEETKAGVAAAANAAKETLLVLLKELDGAVSAQGIVINLVGSREDESELLGASPCVLDPDAVYAQIADDVYPSMGRSRSFTSSEVALCIGGLRRVAAELGITEFQRPNFASITTIWIPNRETLIKEIKRAIVAAGGEDLAAMYTHRKAVEFVTNTNFVGAVVPVFVRNASPALLVALKKFFQVAETSLSLTESKNAFVKALSGIKKVAQK